MHISLYQFNTQNLSIRVSRATLHSLHKFLVWEMGETESLHVMSPYHALKFAWGELLITVVPQNLAVP